MIHSSKSTAAVKERGFPKLRVRKFDGAIVLFFDSTSGTLVYAGKRPGDIPMLGYHCRNWNDGEFEDYLESVVLEND